jgi:hypothetical protein
VASQFVAHLLEGSGGEQHRLRGAGPTARFGGQVQQAGHHQPAFDHEEALGHELAWGRDEAVGGHSWVVEGGNGNHAGPRIRCESSVNHANTIRSSWPVSVGGAASDQTRRAGKRARGTPPDAGTTTTCQSPLAFER